MQNIQEARFKDEETRCEVSLGGKSMNSCGVSLERKRECGQELDGEQGTPRNRRKIQQRKLLHQSLSHPGMFVWEAEGEAGEGEVWSRFNHRKPEEG